MARAKGGLTDKQQAFVREYLVDLNASAAARRAGYSLKTADRTGHENLKKPEIQAAIQIAMDARAERTEVTADETVQELARVGYSDVRKLFDENGRLRKVHELDSDTAAAIASVEVSVRKDGSGDVEHVHKLRLWDKPGALDKLMRHLGAYAADKHEVTGKDGKPLTPVLNVTISGQPAEPTEDTPDAS